MRDKNLPYIQFKQQVERQVQKILTQSTMLRRTPVVATPTRGNSRFRIIFPRKFHSTRGLVIISWYLPESLRYEFLLGLEEKLNQYNFKQKLELKILLSSKENCLKFLYDSERFSSHELFGNILREGLLALESTKILREKYILKRRIRRRGYNDKGSLRASDRWSEKFDWTFTEAQNRKERNQIILDKSVDFIVNWLERNF